MRRTMTDKGVAALKPRAKRYVVADAGRAATLANKTARAKLEVFA